MQAKANWRNDVRQASQRLHDVTETVTALAGAAEWREFPLNSSKKLFHVDVLPKAKRLHIYIVLAETPNPQLRERAKELYFASNEFLHACTEAIFCNTAIWSRFQAGYLLGAVGIGLGAPGIVCAVQKGVKGGVSSLVPATAVGGAFAATGIALSALSFGFGVVELWNARKYDNICKSREFNALLVPTVPVLYKLCRCYPNINFV